MKDVERIREIVCHTMRPNLLAVVVMVTADMDCNDWVAEVVALEEDMRMGMDIDMHG
jgi:hypothetical protein